MAIVTATFWQCPNKKYHGQTMIFWVWFNYMVNHG